MKMVYLRTNLFSFLEIDGGVMLGARYQWNNLFSITVDPTFIFFNPYFGSLGEVSGPLGIKIRADMRYHIPKEFLKGRMFIAPEFHYKYRTIDRQATFGINCAGGNCPYFMEAIYAEDKTEIGGSLKTGGDLPLDKRERLAFEIYGGLGLKVFKYKERNIPTGGSFLNEPSHQDIFGTAEGIASPMLFGSIKLSYRIR